MLYKKLLYRLFPMFVAPSFNEFGQINECIGCPHSNEICNKCGYNPKYWDGRKYIGIDINTLEINKDYLFATKQKKTNF